MNQFLAKFQRTKQVGPEDWDYVWTEKMFSEKTTLKEIKSWAKEKLNERDHIDFRIEKLEITEPEL